MKTAPVIPVRLGLLGLLPFWLLALALVTRTTFGIPQDRVALALATYGATILSFLGGVRWGVALAAPDRPRAGIDFVLSVLPQLAGWAALACPDPWRLLLLGVMILGLGPLDRGLVRRGEAPAWFGDLRVKLSVGAGAALLLAGLG